MTLKAGDKKKSKSKPPYRAWNLDIGANFQADGSVFFKVWAPRHNSIALQIEKRDKVRMIRDDLGYFSCELKNIEPGECYFYVFENGEKRPDPVSRSLPMGVHGPSQIIDNQEFEFTDHSWKGIDLRKCIFYELHVGTFSADKTFDGIIQKLGYLKDLGINCIELMPLAQFSGKWNWGYDGVSLYTPFGGYGGVHGLKKFVNCCHFQKIAVCLDVVYNHLGPEGNYLEEFGPYFSSIYHTPWGKAFNYDGAYSDHVREYVIKNALYWVDEYHIDILRLDALHGIFDMSATPMLYELLNEVRAYCHETGKKVSIIAESGLNDSRVLRPHKEGGLNFDGLWSDDFHHASHVALTKEKTTYYSDFTGLSDCVKFLLKGSVFEGNYSKFRKRRHGNSFENLSFDQFIVFIQNHDQIGNRPFGERLSKLISKERLKIAACLVLMTPAIPLLFMGEEFAETAPFEYFVDFEDERLMDSIYEGRKREFHRDDMPFPGKESFVNSSLTWKHDEEILNLYKELIGLRKANLAKKGISGKDIRAGCSEVDEWIFWEYPTENQEWIGVFCNLSTKKIELDFSLLFKHASKGKILLNTKQVTSQRENVWNIPSECSLIVK